ncbi:MAG: hypothetical protein WC916_06455 [Candidatus Woesearchaeota archaeon]
MAKKLSKKSVIKKHTAKKGVSKKTIPKKRFHSVKTGRESSAQYKKELLKVNTIEENYDKVFEEKLAEQYREFRNNKEHFLQTKKFYRAIMIIVIIMLLVALLLTFG